MIYSNQETMNSIDKEKDGKNDMYGVIDIGSNTMRLVIYQVKNNKIIPMISKKYSAGLAGYVDKNNCLKESGIHKALYVLLEFKELLQYIHVEEVFPFATASLRNIENSMEVLEILNEKTGFQIEILSGQEEALYDYFGAIQTLNMNSGIMVDIGGGSTELVFFKNKEVSFTHSLPIGSLNLYSKYVTDIIPTKKEMIQIEKEVLKQLDDMNFVDLSKEFNHIYGVGGTARAVTKMVNRKKKEESNSYSVFELEKIITKVSDEPKKVVDAILKTCPDRIHTFLTGLITLDVIAKVYESEEIITSHYGVREGYIHDILKKKGVLYEK